MKSRKQRINEDYIDPHGSPEESPGFILSKTSIDAQVNAWLQRFEEESAGLSEAFVNKVWAKHALHEGFGFLFEQDKDPSEDLADLDAAFGADMDASVDDIVSDIGSGADVLDVVSMPPTLDVENFASRVQSLIETIQHKLEFKNPVVNMAVMYLQDQYDQDMADRFVEKIQEMGYKVKVDQPAAEPDAEGEE